MRRGGLGLLGLFAVCAAAVAANAVGCQADGNSPPPEPTGGGAGGSTGTSSDGGGGSAATGNVGGGGTGGSLPVVTIQDITSGTVGEAVDVEVHGVVAMSRKWLVSKSKNTGSCLWGVFLSAPGLTETGPHTGLLAVSYGTQGVLDPNNNLICPNLEVEPVGDAFPDDVKPGDVLDVRGETSYFLLSQCASQPPDTNPSQVKQRQLAKVNLVTRTGTGPVPAPHVVTPEELTNLSSPTDQAFHDMWGGVWLRIEGPVLPSLYTDAMNEKYVVWPYGNVYLAGSNLQIGDKIYYVQGSADPCHSGPNYANINLEWMRIDGFSSIDYCRWSLQPTNKCNDFDPPSDECVGGGGTGGGGGGGLVCP